MKQGFKHVLELIRVNFKCAISTNSSLIKAIKRKIHTTTKIEDFKHPCGDSLERQSETKYVDLSKNLNSTDRQSKGFFWVNRLMETRTYKL